MRPNIPPGTTESRASSPQVPALHSSVKTPPMPPPALRRSARRPVADNGSAITDEDSMAKAMRRQASHNLDFSAGGRSQKRPNVPSASQKLEAYSDGAQNFGPSKGRKEDRDVQGIDSAKGDRDCSLKVDDHKLENVKRDIMRSKIEEITENDRLPDAEAVEKLVQLLQLDRTERKIDIASRARVADIIAATENPDCLGRFIKLRGFAVLNEWLQETHNGKSGEGGSSKETDKPAEKLILALLRALAKLPISLSALHSCTIGKSVNRLRGHKDQTIQGKAKCLVQYWKLRVDDDMHFNDAINFKGVDATMTPAKRKFIPPKQSKYKAYNTGEHEDGQSSLFSNSISTSLSSSEKTDQVTELKALQSVFIDANAEPAKLSYPFIKCITRDFSQEIGRGGFGVVYLGDLGTGKVAVKKLSITLGFSDALFVDEIKCLIRTKHRNIVRFVGYCADTHGELLPFNGSYVLAEVPQRLLCFEYVPNGNLQKYLNDKSHKDDWQIRLRDIKML